MGDESEDVFMLEDVETLVKQNLQAVLSEVQYDSERVGTWTNQVIDSCLRGLQAMGKSYKYIVTCILLQKNGAGLHTAAGAYWDGKKDGICKVPWENASMHCIVTIFGLAIAPSPQAILPPAVA